MLSKTTMNNAMNVADKLRQAIERCKFEEVADRNITFSIGVAQCSGSGKSKEDIIERADEALYKAKRTGKNKVLGS